MSSGTGLGSGCPGSSGASLEGPPRPSNCDHESRYERNKVQRPERDRHLLGGRGLRGEDIERRREPLSNQSRNDADPTEDRGNRIGSGRGILGGCIGPKIGKDVEDCVDSGIQ